MKSSQFYILVAVSMLTVTACATVPMTGSFQPQIILRDALSSPLPDIETRAEKGDAKAQYSLYVLHEYGLRGKTKDDLTAAQWRKIALGAHGSMPITQYIPGLNGKPGRTTIINVPKYGVSAAEAAVVDACSTSLATTPMDQDAAAKCGGTAVAEELKALWNAALTE